MILNWDGTPLLPETDNAASRTSTHDLTAEQAAIDEARVLLDLYDGLMEVIHFDPVTGDPRGLELISDAEPLVDANQRAFNEGLANRSCEFRRVGSFDPVFIEKYKQEHGVDPLAKGNEDALHRLLNDSDYRRFRTLPGRV